MVSTADINNAFSFMPITVDDIPEQIKRIDINEATQKK